MASRPVYITGIKEQKQTHSNCVAPEVFY